MNKAPTKTTLPTQEEVYNKLYPMLGLDKYYFLKSASSDNHGQLRRDLLQRNEICSCAIKKYQRTSKKTPTEAEEIIHIQPSSSILTDINNRCSMRKGLATPIVNNWINRKKRIATANRNKNNENTWIG